jgi:uncharacterized protein
MKTAELIVVIILFVPACRSKETQNKTKPATVSDRVIDRADVLSTSAKDSIFSVIQDLENNIGSQIAVLTVQSLNGEDIKAFSLRTANEMNLGRKYLRDGLLLTFAVNEGLIRIEVGKGLDKILTDELTLKISREDLVPPFRLGRYGAGLYNGVTRIKNIIEQNKEMIGQ